MLFQATALLLFLARDAFAGVIVARDETSLYSPGSGKPVAQDVIDYANTGIVSLENPNFDFFASTFAIVMYAVANQADRIDQLFKDKGDGIHEFTYFEPVNHEPVTTFVSFASETSNEGSAPNVQDITGGVNLDGVKDRWWVAAAFTVLKAEFDTYYEKNIGGRLLPTEKGKKYDELRYVITKWRSEGYKGGDIDLTTAHWLLSVLLRRNVALSEFDRAYDVVKQLPAIWYGPSKSEEVDHPSEWRAYALEDLDSAFLPPTLTLSRPDAGSVFTATVKLNILENLPSYLLHLNDLEEEFDPETWYTKSDIPTLEDLARQPQ